MNNKMKLDLTKDREDIINAFEFKNMDNKYTFYYDETNNIRRLILKENGTLNIPIHQVNRNFILAGIVYKDNKHLLNIQQLKSDLYLDKNNNEIKFKHIARGTFDKCLSSKKLNIFLEWLLSNDLYIHYSSIDILYYSIVDIIDSSVQYYPQFRYEDSYYFKTILYEFAKVNLNDFLSILSKYKYPNIEEKKRNKFLSELMVYIDKNKQSILNNLDVVNEHSILVLLDILKSSKNHELTFIEKNINSDLIEEFYLFYQRPLGLFNVSTHTFDEEKQIIEKFDKIEFYDNKNILQNFSFVKSHENDLIQISDVIVGILGKYMTFINELKFQNIPKIKSELDDFQQKTLAKLYKLLIKSELENKAFIHQIAPLTALEKSRLLILEFTNNN